LKLKIRKKNLRVLKRKKNELEQYSESVQRRIAKLTHKWREAERQKDEAERFARAQN
jgi:prefoldin subunit 5